VIGEDVNRKARDLNVFDVGEAVGRSAQQSARSGISEMANRIREKSRRRRFHDDFFFFRDQRVGAGVPGRT